MNRCESKCASPAVTSTSAVATEMQRFIIPDTAFSMTYHYVTARFKRCPERVYVVLVFNVKFLWGPCRAKQEENFRCRFPGAISGQLTDSSNAPVPGRRNETSFRRKVQRSVAKILLSLFSLLIIAAPRMEGNHATFATVPGEF